MLPLWPACNHQAVDPGLRVARLRLLKFTNFLIELIQCDPTMCWMSSTTVALDYLPHTLLPLSVTGYMKKLRRTFLEYIYGLDTIALYTPSIDHAIMMPGDREETFRRIDLITLLLSNVDPPLQMTRARGPAPPHCLSTFAIYDLRSAMARKTY